jgi:hypothetical protein
METKIAYDWLTFLFNANHPRFKEYTIDRSKDAEK